jgi:ABC-type sugar transport system ATPase subunit
MAEVLRTENISKSFPGVLAVDNVSLTVESGEILALVGENGAGKSTLTQILGGAQKPDSGRILLEGQPVTFSSSADAMHAGISMVFQELSLVGSLSVAENIFANRQPVGRFNNIHWNALYREAADFLKYFELELDPRVLVKRLSMGQQQILEILKAISTQPKVLILDEPTSSLTESEIAYLFQNMRKLQKQGMSFIYITHKLSEIFQIASRVIVMRDGRYIGSRQVDEVTENDLVAMMVGRQITNLYGISGESEAGEEFFQVKDLYRRGRFEGISFSLRRGEILGLAGLVGAGRTEVGRAIFGVEPKDSGEIALAGKPLKIESPLDAIHQGIAYLTEDRKGWGLFLGMALRENLIAPSLRRFTTRLDILNRPQIDRFAQQQIKTYDIQTPSIQKKVLNLSGGTQQKCLVAMWMGINPQVLICDEPTRGVDVGARAEIYRKLREFAANKVGIILISSDLPELIGMCDRVLVMHNGKLAGEVKRQDFSEEIILSYAAGIDETARGRNNHAVQAL